MLESDADRQAYLEQLGEPLTINGKPVRGIFESGFLELDLGATVESIEISATFASRDVTGIVHDDIVRRGSDQFRVVGIQPDGEGLTTLLLDEV